MNCLNCNKPAGTLPRRGRCNKCYQRLRQDKLPDAEQRAIEAGTLLPTIPKSDRCKSLFIRRSPG